MQPPRQVRVWRLHDISNRELVKIHLSICMLNVASDANNLAPRLHADHGFDCCICTILAWHVIA